MALLIKLLWFINKLILALSQAQLTGFAGQKAHLERHILSAVFALRTKALWTERNSLKHILKLGTS